MIISEKIMEEEWHRTIQIEPRTFQALPVQEDTQIVPRVLAFVCPITNPSICLRVWPRLGNVCDAYGVGVPSEKGKSRLLVRGLANSNIFKAAAIDIARVIACT